MQAITFQDVESLALEAVPEPTIVDPGDVIVRVTAAGICGSDLHPYFGKEAGLDRGTVMGHEALGEIVETGAAVTRFGVGDRVVAPFTTNCGACFFCSVGLTARCVRGQLFGWVERGQGLHGCQAEYVRVPLAATTTILGLIPLLSDVFFVNMSITIMAGLGFASILTLIGVPVLYHTYLRKERKAEQEGEATSDDDPPADNKKSEASPALAAQ